MACGRGDRWQGYGSNSKPPRQHVFRDGELLHRSSSGERDCVSCAAKSVASLRSCQAGHGKWAARPQPQATEHELMDKPNSRRKPARSSCYSFLMLLLPHHLTSKKSRVVVLASGQFHLRRDPHACCSSLTGDGCVICERRGHRVLRSCGAVEEW